MTRAQVQVRKFHEKFNIVVRAGLEPALHDPSGIRADLIREECGETLEAMARGDLTETIDGLCDLIYVCYGAALAFGVDLEPYFNEVHRTNMKKIGGSVRGDGKIMKPAEWKPPRIAEMLKEGIGKIK